MQELSRHQPIYLGQRTTIDLAYNHLGEKFIVKRRKIENAILSLKNEFKVRSAFEDDFTFYECSDNEEYYVRPYFEGSSLRDFIKKNEISVAQFLQIGINICQELHRYHQDRYLHFAVNSFNIVINPISLSTTLIDVEHVISLDKPLNFLSTKHVDSQYIAPEVVDHEIEEIGFASDFYSLGVIFYELITGELPVSLNTDNTSRSVYETIFYEKFEAFDKGIPPIVKDVILKLVNDNYEERYRSIESLEYDMITIAAHLEKMGRVDRFKLDEVANLRISSMPDVIMGRNDELNEVNEFYTRLNEKTKLLLNIEGDAGVGKSYFVQNFLRNIPSGNGLVLQGRFFLENSEKPYSAWSQVLDGLLDHLLSHDYKVFKKCETELREGIGSLGHILVAICPRFTLLFPEESFQDIDDPIEQLNRVNFVFSQLVKIITTNCNGKLTVFFDDFQWSDKASSDLLVYLLKDPSIRSILFICAYRDDFLWDMDRFKEVLFYGLFVKTIRLQQLEKKCFSDLVETIFNNRLDQKDDFVAMAYSISKGKPLALSYFLKYAAAQEYIYLSRSDLKWRWQAVDFGEFTPGIGIDRLIQYCIDLEEKSVLDFLVNVALIGGRVPKSQVVSIFPAYLDTYDQLIEHLVETGFLVRDGNFLNNEFVPNENVLVANSVLQKQLLARNSVAKTQEKRLLIARGISRSADALKTYEIFDVCRHYLFAEALLKTESERRLLFSQLYATAKLALSGAAFTNANFYLKKGLQLFENSWWEDVYEQCFDYHFLLLQTEAATERDAGFEELTHLLLQKANSTVRKLRVYSVSIDFYRGKGEYDKAIEQAILAAQVYGVKVKNNYSLIDLLPHFAFLVLRLRGKPTSFFKEQPFVYEGEWFEFTKIVSRVGTVVYLKAPSILPFLLSKVAQLAFKNGNTEYSLKAYAAFSIILASNLRDYKNGYKFREVALEIVKKHKTRSATEIEFIANFSSHWDFHISRVLPQFKNGFELGMRNGQVEYACYSLFEYCHHAFFLGYNLVSLESEFSELRERILFSKEVDVMHQQQIYQDAIAILTQKKNNWFQFKDQSRAEQYNGENKTTQLYYNTLKLLLACLFKDRDEYENTLVECENFKEGGSGGYIVVFATFVQAVAIFDGLISGVLSSDWVKNLKKIKRQFKRYSDQCPENFLNKYQLLLGLVEFFSGSKIKAKYHIDKSIELTKKYEFASEEPIIWEIGAAMLYHGGSDAFARVYIKNSLELFNKWGAASVVNDLKSYYDELVTIDYTDEKLLNTDNSEEWNQTGGSKLSLTDEVLKILRASEGILGELDINKLLHRYLRTTVNWTDAKRGLVLLFEKENLFIKSVIDLNTGFISDSEDILLTDCGLLSESVVHHCCRTKQSVVLFDASSDIRFANDPYIFNHRTKSILCSPILSNDSIQGVLYLEDGDAIGVFKREKFDLSKVFTHQFSLTLQNVLRYNKQQEALHARSLELELSNKTVTENNRLIRSSIRYALHIQNSILPSQATFSSTFSDFFIYYQPRDIVSGDFYWIGKVEGKTVVAAVDCTGHGVPGAFMSMIGNSILNNIVLEKKEVNPATILDELHVRVQKTLNQKETLNMDGMDVAIISIDYEARVLEYAGAHNPLLYCVKDKYFKVKADRQAVGGIGETDFKGFSKHTVGIIPGMKVYLFSDGFQDQIGGPKNKKFMKKNFIHLLYNISHYPMAQQENLLKTTYKNWSGDNDFLDDVLVLGLEL